ncbi:MULTISPECIES: SMI1/KNR4 family protein [unclassified Streptomyces]|uniref:SMI1/KNR4 family protein n=1 Tax=unclassified Streptomyces TaxID=2593676 RepID=UPI002256FCDF|nr:MULTISPECIES: SMI1/KNR4 family protein [unclassified Streptomyces]WSU21964.1 SMI1/KNR4 family protein [Streptomyces sp. NBC_01108]MCX4789137.1 SMI1/KNR4 family protein [Streptomyces sp. NBC_01221]MCX4795117.1 SMI1/KNR4 family protein [Streptomyces sp. NBC_01242]WSJ36422.1 SMI1/KNR4 family protein [Streptomyces sp. NBC_01321]WSP62856.1 SMI1/KNR4 family protein [Streptomyces sp. NBC_01240]
MTTDEPARVTTAWNRIQAWLRGHAPVSYATLQPGAGPEELAELEAATGSALPPGLQALWLCSNGSGGPMAWGDPEEEAMARAFLPEGDTFVSASAARLLYGFHTRLEFYDRTWIPFAAYDPDGFTGLFVNATPGDNYGQVGLWNHKDRTVPEGPLLSAFLEDAADKLERGVWRPHAPGEDD